VRLPGKSASFIVLAPPRNNRDLAKVNRQRLSMDAMAQVLE
jgi:hypothetical protein